MSVRERHERLCGSLDVLVPPGPMVLGTKTWYRSTYRDPDALCCVPFQRMLFRLSVRVGNSATEEIQVFVLVVAHLPTMKLTR